MENSTTSKLKGEFLGDDIFFNLSSENIDNKIATDIIFKMSKLNFLTKATIFESEKDENTISG